MDNTNNALIAKALDRPALTRMGHRQQLELAESLARALEAAEAAHAEVSRDLVWNIDRANTWQTRAEAAEAELTRRDTIIENRIGAERIFADSDLERFETVAGPISRSTAEAEKASKYLVSDLAQWVVQLVADVRKRAAAPGLSEAAIMEDERVMAWLEVADHDAFKGCYDAEVPLLDAVMDRITALVDMESTIADLAAAPVSLEAVKAETTTEWNAVRQDATGELWDVYEPFDSREDAERVAAEWRSNNEPGDDPVVVVERAKGVAPGEWRIVSSEVKRG